MEEKEIYSKSVLHRAARTQGHMNAVKRMLEDGRDYYDVLVQIAAVKAELESLRKMIIKDELQKEASLAVITDDEDVLKTINEMIDKLL